MKENVLVNQLDDPVELQKAIDIYERTGNITEELWNFYDVWKRSGGQDPVQFVQEMKQLIPQMGYRGEPMQAQEPPPPGNPRVQKAGPPWPGWENVLDKLKK
jgi:hypothetical protein